MAAGMILLTAIIEHGAEHLVLATLTVRSRPVSPLRCA